MRCRISARLGGAEGDGGAEVHAVATAERAGEFLAVVDKLAEHAEEAGGAAGRVRRGGRPIRGGIGADGWVGGGGRGRHEHNKNILLGRCQANNSGRHGAMANLRHRIRIARSLHGRNGRSSRQGVLPLFPGDHVAPGITPPHPAVLRARSARARGDCSSPPTDRCAAARSAKSRGCCRTRARE